ncbi:MAG: NADPH-dependent assimilatory sulfite reductase hemoprotein subunit [Nitriliruptorales bacterium]|nr:NADPH-dependent assimilatory sulfite reductase hemoprotein subunit [Nitriliruptorales bacterium]
MSKTGRSGVEDIKASSDHLRGSLPEELASDAPAFAKDSAQLLKFHGVYQQEDRDTRRARAAEGRGGERICMVRASVPGGVLDAEQYLALDRLAGEVADGTLRVTTRQGVQYHFTRKDDLATLIGTLNRHLVTTLAACGDVVRNVMCCPAPLAGRPAGEHLLDVAAELSRNLKPKTETYWQLWVDGERIASAAAPPDRDEAGSGEAETEPLYGPTYLPRKFKIGFAYPGDNCVDVYTHDIGIVPDVAGQRVGGFTILVGGGLGMSHNKPSTYPRLADPLCRATADELFEVVSAIIGVQRDHGDRADRRHARLKYLVDDWGLDRFRAEVERRLGRRLAVPAPLAWPATDDHLGWHGQQDGRWFLGLPVPSGRIADDGIRLRTALRRVVERFRPGVRLTPRQDVLLTGIAEGDREAVDQELRAHGVAAVEALRPIERHALACPAMPTCGLALAEAERALPGVIADLKAVADSLGLGDEPLHVRLTGCPNGCARPYSTEIGIVGRGVDRYAVFLGGDADGTRLTSRYADQVDRARLGDVLRPVLAAFRDERRPGERFGDFCDRAGVDALRARFVPDEPATTRSRRQPAAAVRA